MSWFIYFAVVPLSITTYLVTLLHMRAHLICFHHVSNMSRKYLSVHFLFSFSVMGKIFTYCFVVFLLCFFFLPGVIRFCLFIIWVFETKVKFFKNGDLGRFSSISQTYLQCLLLFYTTNSLAWMLKLTFQQFADCIISEPSREWGLAD